MRIEACLLLIPFLILNKRNKGVKIYLKSKKTSIAIKRNSNSNLPVEFNHSKYSTPKITKKNNTPKAKKKSAPLSSILL